MKGLVQDDMKGLVQDDMKGLVQNDMEVWFVISQICTPAVTQREIADYNPLLRFLFILRSFIKVI
jgi:hypothetical protein